MKNIFKISEKKISNLGLILIIILINSGCGKFDLFENMSDSLPAVEMVSVETYNDSTLVIGNIITKGADEVSVCGFCYNLAGNPEMMENQVLLNGTIGEFGILIGDLLEDTTYYFKTFAYNGHGYAQSEEIAYTIPKIGPPNIPCSLIDNVIVDNSISFNINYIYSGSAYATIGGYGVDALYKNTSALLEIDFHGKPSNGIYTTCKYNSFLFDDKNVYIKIKSGMSEFTVNSGGLIYIEEIDDELFTITFCELTYTAFSSEFPLAGKILIH